MLTKLITQVAGLGVLGSTAYASTIIDIADSPLPKQEKAPNFRLKQFPNFPREPNKVTIEDIEIYEATGKCNFIFVDNSGKKKIFKAREWFNEQLKTKPKEQKNYWKSRLTVDVFYEKRHCKNGQLILELGQRGFKPKNGL